MSAPTNAIAAATNGKSLVADARIFGQIPPEILNRKVVVAISYGRQAAKWENKAMTFGQLAGELCRFRRGGKDGLCMLQGALVADGPRSSDGMRAMHNLIFDIDNGATLDDVSCSLDADLCAFIWTTHSHNKTETTINRTPLLQWLKRESPEPTTDEAVRFLVERKKAKPELFEGAKLGPCEPAGKGFSYRLTHKPWPKLRVLLPLAKPFVFNERGGTHAAAVAEWKARYLAAAQSQELDVDTACSDPSRLFFVPRIPDGAPLEVAGHPGAAAIWVYPGKPFDLDAIEIPTAPAAERTKSEAVSPREGFKTANMQRFLAIGAGSFRAADWLRDIAPDDVRNEYSGGQKIDARCPLESLHTEPSEADRAFYAENGNGSSGWQMYCQHATCRGIATRPDGKHDRGVMLDEACAYYEVRDAGALLKWCDASAQAERARNPLDVFNGQLMALVPTAPTSNPVGALIGDLAKRLVRELGESFEEGRHAAAQRTRAPQLAPAAIEIKRVSEQLDQPELPWSVDELMLGGAWGFLVADTGFGKTFILVHLALCLETGRPFFGRKIRQRGGTIVIVGEGAYSTRNRFDAARRYGFPDLKESAARYIDTPPVLAHARGINDKVLTELIERLRQTSVEMQQRDGLPLKLVQFDTFAKCFPNLQEDKAAEAIHAHNVMERIAKALDVAVICASHIGKDASKGMRGSSSHKQNAHFMLTVPKQGGLFLEKVKDAPQGIGLGRFELPIVKLGEKKDGTPITSCYVREGVLGPFGEVAAPEGEAQDDGSDSQKMLRVALLAASDGTVENPATPGAPAANWECVANKFTGLYLNGKTADDKLLTAKRGAWGRATRNPPADVVADKTNNIIYAISQRDA